MVYIKKLFNSKILVALIFIFSALSGILFTACSGNDAKEPENGVSEQGDKRIFSFAEHVGTISNPGMGYTTTDWYHTAVGATPVRDKQGDIVLFFIDLSPFSAAANSDGVDYDLDDRFFVSLRATFENCRKNGSTVAVRFRYDENGRDNPEPNSFEQILKHISQIKQSKVLEDYKDILMFVESGFVGKWGEQHGGKYTSVDYKARLLKAMLDCVPSPIPVTVRTPDTFAKFVGIERNKLADYKAEEGSEASRVGLYNDGYMGSDSDLGTYADREIETQWLSNQTLTSCFGGEFSGNIEFAKKYDAYLPENCIPEMYKTHLTYINSNIFQLYKDYKFDKNYDVGGIDNSAYYGQTVFDFIRDHLGYRFVLGETVFPKKLLQGGILEFDFSLVNKGFANPIKKQKCEIILEKDGNFVTTEVGLEPTKWYSGKKISQTLKIKLPAFLQEGEWKVYLKSSLGVDELKNYTYRSIRFANKDVWNEALGANYLGFVEIQSSGSCDNTIGETDGKTEFAQLYNLGGRVCVDGTVSADEWSANDKIAESGKYSMYAKCDSENLYIAADIPHGSKSPVFNFKAKNAENGLSYWLYQQAGGFIYFNHEERLGHGGLIIKYSDFAFEIKIPFRMLEIENGSQLSEVSVFVQDSADEWKGKGSIKTETAYTAVSDFRVFNAFINLTADDKSELKFKIEADTEIESVVWYLDGIEIASGNLLSLTLKDNAKDRRITAKITALNGTAKTVEIAQINVKG